MVLPWQEEGNLVRTAASEMVMWKQGSNKTKDGRSRRIVGCDGLFTIMESHCSLLSLMLHCLRQDGCGVCLAFPPYFGRRAAGN